MSRFFKSAAFPILIVIVLAFFAQRLISGGQKEKAPTYSEFIAQLAAGDLKTVDLKTKNNTVVVTPRTGKAYETGFTTAGSDRLEAQLQSAEDQGKLSGGYNIQSSKTSGWLSLLTKPERRKADVPIKYVGFEIPNRFAIGYGLDHAERWRNLPYVASLLRPESGS